VLAWGIQRGTSVVPKSVNDERIKSNFECLKVKLDDGDMRDIESMNGPRRFSSPMESQVFLWS
jgi:diketogulonate reductase-like aldo/keto reductase